MVINGWTVQKLQHFILNPRWRSPPSCFKPVINFGIIDVFYIILWIPSSNLVIKGWTVLKLQHFILNPRWRSPPSCFRPVSNFGARDLIYIILCTPSFKFGDNRLNGSKVTACFIKPRWRSPPSCAKESSYNGHFYIVGKGVHDFLIALNVTSVDILHSFLTNRRNVVKISILTLPPSLQPKFEGS